MVQTGAKSHVFSVRTIWSIHALSEEGIKKLYIGAPMTMVAPPAVPASARLLQTQSYSAQCAIQVRKLSDATISEWQTESGKLWRKPMNWPLARGNVLRFYHGRPQEE